LNQQEKSKREISVCLWITFPFADSHLRTGELKQQTYRTMKYLVLQKLRTNIIILIILTPTS